MIVLNKISKTYANSTGPIQVLDNVTLRVETGKIAGIVGPSGAGKSTLLRCINLLERPDTGEIIVDGKNLLTLSATELRQARQKISMIFQHFNLLQHRTVLENIALPLALTQLDQQTQRERIQPLLALTGLDALQNHYPAQLSGGQKQRVAIARALVTQPKVLLCDECTSALDPKTSNTILSLLKDINQRLGVTIVLITHEMSIVKQICDQVAVIDAGHIIEESPVIPLFKNPQTSVARALVQSALQHALPEPLNAQLKKTPEPNTAPLWRIWFSGHRTTEPLIAQALHQFQVELNIYQASIELIHGEVMGIMIVKAQGTTTQCEACQHFLEELGNTVEVIGYVNDDAFAAL